MRRWILGLLFMATVIPLALAQVSAKPAAKKQFMYVLKVVPELRDQSKWTEREKGIVGKHLEWLKKQLSDGKLVLAGRTLEDDPMGIVILEVDSQEEAQAIMDGDEAVKEKVMTGTLHQFHVALKR